MKNPNRFYTYAYLREDRTPYYIGKGNGKRAYKRNGRPCGIPKDKSRIIFLKQTLTEEEAFKHEKYMIAVFGRKDLGTGILHNKTDGGEGVSGRIVSDETKIKLSICNTGKTLSHKTRKRMSQSKKNISEETRLKMSKSQKGRVHLEETKRKMSEANKGENNYLYGRSLPEETKRKLSEANKNKKWWNDGCGNTKFAEECPGEGWVPGRGKIKKK